MRMESKLHTLASRFSLSLSFRRYSPSLLCVFFFYVLRAGLANGEEKKMSALMSYASLGLMPHLVTNFSMFYPNLPTHFP